MYGVLTFVIGSPLVFATYFFVQPSDESPQSLENRKPPEHPQSDNAERLPGEDPIADLEQFRSWMTDEEFDELFGPAIEHERRNPTTFLKSDGDIEKLPPFVDRLDAHNISDAGLERLAGLVAVRELDIGDNPKVTDAGLRHVAKIKRLESLFLGNTRVTDQGVKHLRALPLTFLNIRETRITDISLGYISEMQGMKQVHLAGCAAITDDGVAKLTSLSRLQILNLSGCTKITDKTVLALSAMPAVEFIQVFNCPLVSQHAVDEFLNAEPNREVLR